MVLLVSVEELREHVESDKSDAALTTVLEGVEAEIIERFGAHDVATERRHITAPYVDELILQHIPLAVESVTSDGEALTVEEHYSHASGVLTRVGGYWGERVIITYTPTTEATQRRKLAIIKLAQLELAYSGYKSQSTPDASESPLDYDAERSKIIRSLRSRRVVFA
jgi:hypothetical protein